MPSANNFSLDERSEPVDHRSLPSGSQVRLRLVQADGEVQWVSTQVDEQRSDLAVLVDWPRQRRGFVPLQVGQTVLLTAARDGGLLSVEMLVETLTTSDVPRVLLRPDGPWRRTQRRQDVRLPVLIKPRIAERVSVSGRESVDVVIKNLSAGGVLLVRASQPLEKGEQIELQLEPSKNEAPLGVSVEVVRTEVLEHAEFRLWEAGCRFIDLPPGNLERVTRFISEQERQHAEPGRQREESGG